MLSFKEVDPSVLGSKYKKIQASPVEKKTIDDISDEMDVKIPKTWEETTVMEPIPCIVEKEPKVKYVEVEEPKEAEDIYEKTKSSPAIVRYEGMDRELKDIPNQKVKSDAGKPKLSLVPPQIIFEIAKVREYGNNKYPDGGTDNWKQVEPERYRDAAFRHLLSYIQDPDGVDEESGISHLSHLACNIAFLCELERKGK